MRVLIVLLFLGVGCGTTTPKLVLAPYQAQPVARPIEEREPLPKGDELATGVLAGEKVPFDGVMLSERLAAKLRLIKAERDTLREWLAIERQAAQRRHELVNQALTDMHQRAQRSWLERHAGTLGVYSGFVLGAATCILITYGLKEL